MVAPHGGPVVLRPDQGIIDSSETRNPVPNSRRAYWYLNSLDFSVTANGAIYSDVNTNYSS